MIICSSNKQHYIDILVYLHRSVMAPNEHPIISQRSLVMASAESALTPVSQPGPEKIAAKGMLPPLSLPSTRLPPLNILPPITTSLKISEEQAAVETQTTGKVL